MRVERTDDLTPALAVFNHQAIVRDVWDMGIPKPLPNHPSIYYLLVKDERHSDGAVEDIVLGALMFVPMNPVTWNPHIAILPGYRGVGTEAMRLGMEWMFENTACRKLVAYPPEFNKPMIRVFQKCGWKREGFSPASLLWNGKLHDRVMFGIEENSNVVPLNEQVRMMG